MKEENRDNELVKNFDKMHTTEMGIERIKKNLDLNDTCDVLSYCKEISMDVNSTIIRNGKNWYVSRGDVVITINAYSYTIITAHKIKK